MPALPRTPPKPLSLRASAGILFGVILFGSLMGATACGAIFPASQRLAAPLLCPSGTVKSVVILTTSSNGRGTSTSGQLWCMDAEGGGHPVGTFKVMGTLFLMYTLALIVLVGLAWLVSRMRRPATLSLLVLGGCGWGTMSNAEFDKAYPYGRGDIFTHAGAKAVQAELHARLGVGPIRVTTLYLDPSSVSATVQDPKQPEHLDNYRYSDGSLGQPAPERLSLSERDQLPGKLFDLDAVPFARVADLVSQALTAAKLEDGHVTSMQISRGDHGMTIYVQLEGPRASAHVEFDGQGKLLEASQQ